MLSPILNREKIGKEFILKTFFCALRSLGPTSCARATRPGSHVSIHAMPVAWQGLYFIFFSIYFFYLRIITIFSYLIKINIVLKYFCIRFLSIGFLPIVLCPLDSLIMCLFFLLINLCL